MLPLLISFLLAQDSPADVLKKIEETVAAAETIRAEYKIDGITDKKKAPAYIDGVIEVRRGNKVRIVQTTFVGGGKTVDEILSDGVHIVAMNGDRRSLPREAPKTLEAQARAWFSTLPIMASPFFGAGPNLDKDSREDFKVAEVKKGDDDGALKSIVVTYKPRIANAVSPEVRIWYDPKTFLISRRAISIPNGPRIREILPKLALDAKLPEEYFLLPE